MENSQTTSVPRGLVTRRISFRAATVSATLRSPNEIVTASKLASAYGSWSASAAMKLKSGLRCLPTSNMPNERSVGMTMEPLGRRGSLDVPVPAARSKMSCPRLGSTASTT